MDSRKKEIGSVLLRVLMTAAVIWFQWRILERSMLPPESIHSRAWISSIISICVVAALTALVGVLTGRLSLTLILSTLFSLLLAVGNYYVNTLHGSPLRISELKSFGTAMDVIGGFRLDFPPLLQTMLVWTAVIVLLAVLSRTFLDAHRGKSFRLSCAGMLAAAAAVVAIGFSGSHRPEIGFSWDYAANLYGYPACLVEDTIEYRTKFIKPEDYSEEKIDEIAARLAPRRAGAERRLPDVILILNETYYDPAVYQPLGLKADADYMAFYHSLESAARGFAVVPNGGTNSSEYELLTSNSKALINPSAPFNILELANTNSIVSYLETLGYETWAMHCQSGSNYSRAGAYSDLGFDHILFQDDFDYRDKYGNRYRTDSGDYKTLIDSYEASQSGPRFLFMLTYQNHGGYEQNEPEWDTVHTRTDLGEWTDDMDEFLTSMSMSDAALRELLDYFTDCGRPVVVIMAGDHAPAFVAEHASAYYADKTDDRSCADHILMSATPYLIWCSFRDVTQSPEYITLSDLVPMALNLSGVPLSRYYQTIVDLQREQSVHVSGVSMTASGRLIPADAAEDPNSVLRTYLNLEYHNLVGGERRRQELYDPPVWGEKLPERPEGLQRPA